MDTSDRCEHRPIGNTPRVIVVSGILLYREGLAASLGRDARLDVVAVVNIGGAVPAAMDLRPDVVVLDASAAEGLALAKQLKSADPDLPLVGFGVGQSAVEVIGCAEAGLVGFIDQNGTIDELVRVVRDALRGEFKCPPKVTAILCSRLARLANRGSQPNSSLTPRELQIATMVADGLSNKEIARGLHIGPTTVKNHVHNILDKLNVRRRAAIASRVPDPARSSLSV